MKKFTALSLVVFVLIAGVLAGCGGEKAETTSIVFIDEEGEEFEEVSIVQLETQSFEIVARREEGDLYLASTFPKNYLQIGYGLTISFQVYNEDEGLFLTQPQPILFPIELINTNGWYLISVLEGGVLKVRAAKL